MKYALLIYPTSDAPSGEPPSAEEQAAVRNEYMEISRDDAVLGGEGLEAPTTATTLRVQNGETLVTDGPFANTKEFLGGFYIVDADNLDRAIDVAQRIPALRFGGAIEVRPVLQM